MSDAPGHTSKALLVICAIVIFIAMLTAMRLERENRHAKAAKPVASAVVNGQRILVYQTWSQAVGRCRWDASCSPR